MTARGRQPSAEQLMEELRMEIRATAYDLIDHDRWDLDALRTAKDLTHGAIDAILAGRVSVARSAILAGLVSLAMSHLQDLDAVLSEHQSRDIHENRKHRHVAVVAKDGIA